MSYTINNFLRTPIFIIFLIALCAPANAGCGSTGYGLKDTKGNIFPVLFMKECFHFFYYDFNKSYPLDPHKCLSEKATDRAIARIREHLSRNTTKVGTKIIATYISGSKLYIFQTRDNALYNNDQESKYILVTNKINENDLSYYVKSNMMNKLIDGDSKLDFTDHYKNNYALSGKVLELYSCE